MPVLTVNVSEELFEKLQKLAIDMKSSVEQCQVWAIEDFLAEERPDVDAVLEAEQDIAEGRVVTQEQMEAWVESLDTAHPLPVPSPQKVPIQQAS